ncbi:AraC family transcriptional regulator [Glycomyces sp. NRRL B-16210]|uniref:helix-turn-helix domain-containing protein n=1 Tax=Glycomyces sp. NRRL B-16210 TaxID=1463821 RepID=UPI000689ABC8|nr:AraC family transcriptional regulator [Glycomyces sp. NRRL B-16210]
MRECGTYTERAVEGALGAWSPCRWVHTAGEGAQVRVVPDGCVDLLWLGDRLEVAGPDAAPRLVDLAPGATVAGVRLRPGAARLLLGPVPATAVRDAQPHLDRLWDNAAALADRAAAAPDAWAATEILAAALEERLVRHAPDPVAVAVAAALDRPRPPSVTALARALGYSERHLRRRVRAAAGYGPKTLEQILRFRRAAAAAGDGRNWTRVAAEAGYADQAHLSRQVRRWSGGPPSAL